jgi:hypothetical protein
MSLSTRILITLDSLRFSKSPLYFFGTWRNTHPSQNINR